MELDEAIKVKLDFFKEHQHIMSYEERLADALSVEALKREGEYRQTAPVMNIVLLPGETED